MRKSGAKLVGCCFGGACTGRFCFAWERLLYLCFVFPVCWSWLHVMFLWGSPLWPGALAARCDLPRPLLVRIGRDSQRRQVVSACTGGLINAHQGQLQKNWKHVLVLEFVLHRRSRPWKCPRVQGWCKQSRSSHDRLGPATPFVVDEHISPVPAVSYASTALAVYAVSCASGVYAALAPVVEYISPAPAVSHAAPVPVAQYISPAPGAEYTSPAPEVSYAAPIPLQHAVPVLHATPTKTVTGIGLNRDGLSDLLQQPRVGFATPLQYRGTSPVWKTTELRSVLPDGFGKSESVDKSCPSIFAALGAANPHGLDDCPNSVLPAGFDMRGSVDIPCPSSFAPVCRCRSS